MKDEKERVVGQPYRPPVPPTKTEGFVDFSKVFGGEKLEGLNPEREFFVVPIIEPAVDTVKQEQTEASAPVLAEPAPAVTAQAVDCLTTHAWEWGMSIEPSARLIEEYAKLPPYQKGFATLPAFGIGDTAFLGSIKPSS